MSKFLSRLHKVREVLSVLLKALGFCVFVIGAGTWRDLRSIRRKFFRLSEKYVAHRISVLVRNSGSVAVRDVKAMLELESPGPEELSRLIVKDCNFECPVKCHAGYLVNRYFPIVRGPLPWAVPERPVVMPHVTYTHITSISPHQGVRLLLFEFIPLHDGRYLIRLYSEYSLPLRYRVFLYLNEKTTLRAKITVSGENARRPLIFYLGIRKEILDEILKCIEKGDISTLQKLFRF